MSVKLNVLFKESHKCKQQKNKIKNSNFKVTNDLYAFTSKLTQIISPWGPEAVLISSQADVHKPLP